MMILERMPSMLKWNTKAHSYDALGLAIYVDVVRYECSNQTLKSINEIHAYYIISHHVSANVVTMRDKSLSHTTKPPVRMKKMVKDVEFLVFPTQLSFICNYLGDY